MQALYAHLSFNGLEPAVSSNVTMMADISFTTCCCIPGFTLQCNINFVTVLNADMLTRARAHTHTHTHTQHTHTHNTDRQTNRHAHHNTPLPYRYRFMDASHLLTGRWANVAQRVAAQ